MTTDSVRKAVISTSVFLTLVGMGLSIGAILTPSWQVCLSFNHSFFSVIRNYDKKHFFLS
jgi:hypothetical protein